MIYEVRTYQLLPGGAVQEFYKRFTEAYEAGRNKLTPIAGAFFTEFGPLNQVVTIWPYESEAHREASASVAMIAVTEGPVVAV